MEIEKSLFHQGLLKGTLMLQTANVLVHQGPLRETPMEMGKGMAQPFKYPSTALRIRPSMSEVSAGTKVCPVIFSKSSM